MWIDTFRPIFKTQLAETRRTIADALNIPVDVQGFAAAPTGTTRLTVITDEILIEDIVELVDNAITQANIDVEPIWRAHRAAESRRRRIADRGAARATPSDYWRNINERVRELTPTSDYRFRPVCQWQVGDVTDVRDALVSGSVFAQRQ